MTRPALLRAAVVPFVAAPLLASCLLAPPAQAGTATTHGGPVLAAPAHAKKTADADRPVRIEVGRFEPRTVTPGATVTVAGTLTNTGTEAIDGLTIRLQRGEVRTTREELAAAARDPDPATAVTPGFRPVPGTLSLAARSTSATASPPPSSTSTGTASTRAAEPQRHPPTASSGAWASWPPS